MPSAVPQISPGLGSYLKSLKGQPADTSVELLVASLKRRHIAGSRPCAVATTHLFLQVIAQSKYHSVSDLVKRVREVGRRLIAANSRELAVGNIIRRVLGLIREVNETEPAAEEHDHSQAITPMTPGPAAGLGDLMPGTPSAMTPSLTPSLEKQSLELSMASSKSMKDVKDDVLNGMREMLDELDQADEQIAGYSLEHIHASQTILTYSSSTTVQKFLLAAAKRRKFTVIQVEGYPNEHRSTYESVISGRRKNDAEEGETENRLRTLTSMGITVIVVPDSAVFSIMSRVNSVILPAHAVMPNGSFVGAAGVKMIAQAAKAHGVPVLSLGAIYKLSPVIPNNFDSIVGFADSGKTLQLEDEDLYSTVPVINPSHDHVPPELVDVFITNIGAHMPSFIYRIVADHYRQEDIEL